MQEVQISTRDPLTIWRCRFSIDRLFVAIFEWLRTLPVRGPRLHREQTFAIRVVFGLPRSVQLYTLNDNEMQSQSTGSGVYAF